MPHFHDRGCTQYNLIDVRQGVLLNGTGRRFLLIQSLGSKNTVQLNCQPRIFPKIPPSGAEDFLEPLYPLYAFV